MSMLDRLLNNFRSDNKSLCLYIDGELYTYSDIAEKAGKIQKLLLNSVNENIIGIVTDNIAETYAAIIACWLSGKGFVPINNKYPVERNDNIIKQASINHIISASKNTADFLSTEKISVIDPGNNLKSESVLAKVDIGRDQTFCILFTSGTTGIPKGVPMTLKNIECTLESFFALNYSLDSSDRFLQMFELTFDMSMISYLPAFLIGASVFPVSSNKIRYIEALKIMKEQDITFAAMVPSTLSLLRPYFPKISLPKMKYSLLGGEPFPADLASEWSKCIPNCQIVNISGPTEITMACMGYDLDIDFNDYQSHNGILAFGYPWKNTSAIIIDEKQNILGKDEKGELCFAGDHVMDGYLNQPELNGKVFFEKTIQNKTLRFYRTGDMAMVNEKGLFYTCGRKDLQIKIQGHKVELEEIEFVAQKILKNHNIVAIPILNQNNLHEINLLIEGEYSNDQEIISKLKNILPPYMIPAKISFIESFVYNPNGKIDRLALKNLFK